MYTNKAVNLKYIKKMDQIYQLQFQIPNMLNCLVIYNKVVINGFQIKYVIY